MTDYKQRVVDELTDLKDKIQKLEAFLTAMPVQLEAHMLSLMKLQLGVMKQYAMILEHRMNLF